MITRIIGVVKHSLKPALKTSAWILKWMIPITLATALLNYFGIISIVSDALTPVFAFMGLSGESALVFITASVANIYSAIAVMASMDLGLRAVTILAVMCLICHNLIVETMIQHKAGASAWMIVGIRISGAVLSAVVMNAVLPDNMSGRLLLARTYDVPESLTAVFGLWSASMLKMSVMVVVFITSLNIIQGLLREFRLIDYLVIPVSPIVRFFGLSGSTSFLWIVANTLGLAYGGGVLINDISAGEIAEHDAKLLNTHIALSHSLLEDTILFAAVGVGVFWLVVPRLAIAFVAVHMQRFARRRSLYYVHK